VKIYVDAKAIHDGNGTKKAPSWRLLGNGTKKAPFKQINDAAQVAQPGDKVLVFPGTYR